MINAVLERKELTKSARISIKALLTFATVVAAVGLPQLVHLVAGSGGGVKWLPMYLPVLFGACLLGPRWGVIAGIASPAVSFLLTSAAGNPMPAAARLPFMAAELALMALVCGLFSAKLEEKPLLSFAAVAAALVAGRVFFLLLVTVFASLVPFTPQVILGQIVTGIPGLILCATAVPLALIAVSRISARNEKH